MFSIDFLDSACNLQGHTQGYYEVNNVIVSTKAGPHCSLPLLTDQQGNLIAETLDEQLYWHPSPLNLSAPKEDIEKTILLRNNLFNSYLSHYEASSKNRLEIDGQCIWLGHSHGWYPYGHLHDSLSRLYRIRDRLDKNNLTFLCSNWDRVTDFHDHLNACVGRTVNRESIICINDYDTIECSEMLFSLPSAPVTTFTKECHKWLHSSYLAYFNIDYNPSSRKPIYLSRNHIVPGKRGVVNESDILEYLTSFDTIILTGAEPLREIVNAFHHASAVIGPHGSLFANLLFSKEDCLIVEYCSSNRVDKSFLLKQKYAKDYHQIIVDADENFNIHIDIGRLKELLNG